MFLAGLSSKNCSDSRKSAECEVLTKTDIMIVQAEFA